MNNIINSETREWLNLKPETQSCVTRKIVLHLITSGSSFSEAFNYEMDSVHKGKKKSVVLGVVRRLGSRQGETVQRLNLLPCGPSSCLLLEYKD